MDKHNDAAGAASGQAWPPVSERHLHDIMDAYQRANEAAREAAGAVVRLGDAIRAAGVHCEGRGMGRYLDAAGPMARTAMLALGQRDEIQHMGLMAALHTALRGHPVDCDAEEFDGFARGSGYDPDNVVQHPAAGPMPERRTCFSIWPQWMLDRLDRSEP